MNRIITSGQNETELVNVSIIVAVKNELKNITGLTYHLKNANYPFELFEVIFVDDNSSDSTYVELSEQAKSIKNFSVLNAKSINVNGKREALTLGIKEAIYPFLLITDADCTPERDWLNSYSNKFEDGYDMLFGIAPFYQNNSLINKISCFENLRSTILSLSMASIGLPYSAAARNFGFSKNAFKSLGGYSQTKDTLSGDDDLLLREAVKHKMKIGVVTEPGSFVFSETKKTFSEYFQQRARHTQTSFHYLLKHQIILGGWHLFNLFFLLSPFLMFVNPLLGILLPAKLLLDLFLVKLQQKKFGYFFSTFEIIYLQVLYEIFLIIHFLNAKFLKIEWK